jgi:hypothetical protein
MLFDEYEIHFTSETGFLIFHEYMGVKTYRKKQVPVHRGISIRPYKKCCVSDNVVKKIE